MRRPGPTVYRPYPRRLVSPHLRISLQRQHFLLSYLKTLSVGPGGVFEPTTSRTVARCSAN